MFAIRSPSLQLLMHRPVEDPGQLGQQPPATCPPRPTPTRVSNTRERPDLDANAALARRTVASWTAYCVDQKARRLAAPSVIIPAWRAHREHLNMTRQNAVAKVDDVEEVVVKYRSTNPKVVTLEYWPENTDLYIERQYQCGRVFYFNWATGRALHYPHQRVIFRNGQAEPVVDEDAARTGGTEMRGQSGACKQLVDRDGDFVALNPMDGKPLFDVSKPPPPLPDGLRSLVLSTVINDTLMIARNAGPDLFDHAKAGNVLTLEAFRIAVCELQQLHTFRDGRFLRDIKPENLTFRFKPSHLTFKLKPGDPPYEAFVHFIDVEDDLICGRELRWLHGNQVRGTAALLTWGLKHGLYVGRSDYRRHFARTADEYAMLLSIIFATTPWSAPLSAAALCADLPPGAVAQPGHRGAMRPENAALFEPWLARHVRPAFVARARQLLRHPASVAFGDAAGEGYGQPTHVPLAQMLQFSDSVAQDASAVSVNVM